MFFSFVIVRFKQTGFHATAGVLLLGSFVSTATIVGYYKMSVDFMGGK